MFGCSSIRRRPFQGTKRKANRLEKDRSACFCGRALHQQGIPTSPIVAGITIPRKVYHLHNNAEEQWNQAVNERHHHKGTQGTRGIGILSQSIWTCLVRISIFLSVSVFLCVCLTVRLSVCPSVCVSLRPSPHLLAGALVQGIARLPLFVPFSWELGTAQNAETCNDIRPPLKS